MTEVEGTDGASPDVSRAVVGVAVVVAALSTVAALVGLLATGGVTPRTVTSVHGEVCWIRGVAS